MMKYHGKGKGKVYAPSDARIVLCSCLVTWKATRPDRDQPFFYDDCKSQLPPDRALFVSLHTGRVYHRVGSEFIVEAYNPYRFSRQFGYTPTIPGLPGNSSSHTPPLSYKTWLSELVLSESLRSTYVKHGKGKGLPTCVRPSSLVFQSSGSSKRKRSSSMEVSSSVSSHERTKLLDTGGSPECLAIEVAESHPPAPLVLSIAKGAKAILRTGDSSPWA
ncbi:hypothetical protein LIER_14696 [Lithospermum erythrorhizon]|uniref:Uncharacterized protein n=1 Tax=Lithospermum erythrorhizon TaxID=34254 RepID=A0AAV3Q2G7_LITER